MTAAASRLATANTSRSLQAMTPLRHGYRKMTLKASPSNMRFLSEPDRPPTQPVRALGNLLCRDPRCLLIGRAASG